MTSLSRRKRRTTRPSTPAVRTACSRLAAAAVALAAAAGGGPAAEWVPGQPPPSAVRPAVPADPPRVVTSDERTPSGVPVVRRATAAADVTPSGVPVVPKFESPPAAAWAVPLTSPPAAAPIPAAPPRPPVVTADREPTPAPSPLAPIRPAQAAERAVSPVPPAPESSGGLRRPPAVDPDAGGQPVLLQKPSGSDTPRPAPAEPTPLASEVAPPPGLVQSGLPDADMVFELESDRQLDDRFLKELREGKEFSVLPDRNTGGTRKVSNRLVAHPDPGGPGPFVAKTASYPPVRLGIEAGFVVHRRLYFEELNSERYGWDAGITQPAISALYFYRDVLLWPARLASNHDERYDVNLGKCLPGSPVPYYLYPPEIDLWGALAAGGFYTGMGIILP